MGGGLEMKKAPNRANSTGAFEQLSFLPTPEFCPILPTAGTQAAQALEDLSNKDITQADWLPPNSFKGWRLSAAIKELDYLGWQPDGVMVNCGRKRPIKRYSLPAKAKAAYFTLTKGGADATE
jgi:hypothetical protein